MKKTSQPYNQIFWCTNANPEEQPCVNNLDIEVAVIGGGMAGLSAAQAFAKRGKKVALLEQYFCGAGATGKSGGFITPNAELSLSDFEKNTNTQSAQKIWKFITEGMENIKNNIVQNNFDCGYNSHAGLFVANCKRTLKNLQQEHENVLKMGHESKFFDQQSLQTIIGSEKYVGGITYENSFGINPYKYCSALKRHLIDQGVLIFENTPVTNIDNHTITTQHAKVTAKYIIICIDKFLPDLGKLKEHIYHAQNYILVSDQLTTQQIKQLFPQKQYMVWDSKLIYNYYRLTEDQRLLIGGGDLFSIYSKEKHNYTYGRNKLTRYIKKMFPEIDVTFTFQRPGLIGISKDIGPLAGPDQKHSHIYYIAGSAGLPIANALAHYSTQHLLDKRTDFDDYFKPNRPYFIGNTTQKIIGKKLSFALNNFMSQNTVGCF